MKLAYCKFCNDYTQGTRNEYRETKTQIFFWHVCKACGVSTDCFTQKDPANDTTPAIRYLPALVGMVA